MNCSQLVLLDSRDIGIRQIVFRQLPGNLNSFIGSFLYGINSEYYSKLVQNEIETCALARLPLNNYVFPPSVDRAVIYFNLDPS